MHWWRLCTANALIVSVFASSSALAMEDGRELMPEYYLMVFDCLEKDQLACVSLVSRAWQELARHSLCRKISPRACSSIKRESVSWSEVFRVFIRARELRDIATLSRHQITALMDDDEAIERVLILRLEAMLIDKAHALRINSPKKLLIFVHTYFAILFDRSVRNFLLEIDEDCVRGHHWETAREYVAYSLLHTLGDYPCFKQAEIIEGPYTPVWHDALASVRRDINICHDKTGRFKRENSKKRWSSTTKHRSSAVEQTQRLLSQFTKWVSRHREHEVFRLSVLLILVYAPSPFEKYFDEYYGIIAQRLRGFNCSKSWILGRLFDQAWSLRQGNPFLESLRNFVLSIVEQMPEDG